MDNKRFKRFYHNSIKKDYKRYQEELEITKKEIAKIQEIVTAVKRINILNSEVVVYSYVNDNQRYTIEVDYANKSEVLKNLRKDLDTLEARLTQIEDRLSMSEHFINLLDMRPFIAVKKNPFNVLLDVIFFALKNNLPMSDILETICMIAHIDGSYLKEHGLVNPQVDLMDPEDLLAMTRIANHYDENGQLVPNIDQATYLLDVADFYSVLLKYMYIVDREVVQIHHDKISELLMAFSNQYSNYLAKSNKPSFNESIVIPVNTQTLPIEPIAYENLQAIKKYLRNGEIIAPLEPQAFAKLLLAAGYSQNESQIYAKKMTQYIANQNKQNEISKQEHALTELFNPEEIALYKKYRESSDIVTTQIIDDLESIIELFQENPASLPELLIEKESLIAYLKTLEPTTTIDAPLFYLNDNLIPPFMKDYDKMSKQDKRKSLALIDKLKNESSIINAKPVLGIKINSPRIMYISSGKFRLCFAEYAPNSYLIVSLGKAETAFAEAQRIASSSNFKKFITDLQNPNFLSSTQAIANQQFANISEELELSIDSNQLLLSQN